MASKFTIPDSVRKLVGQSIEQIFDELRVRLLGSFAQPAATLLKPVKQERHLTLPGVYVSAYISGGAKNQPNFNDIQGLAAVTDQYLQATSEKFKAKAYATIQQQIDNSSGLTEDEFEQTLNNALIEIFDKVQAETKRVVETELHRVKTVAINDSVTEFAKEQGDNDPSVYCLTRLDKKVCTICRTMYEMDDGTPIIYKLSELSKAFYNKDTKEPCLPPNNHPNCILNGDARVLTKKGYVPIKHITIGDEVLTHKNRFKKVINTLSWYQQLYHDEYYTVNFKNIDGYEVKVTPDHQFFTSEGFKPVKNITNGKIMTLQRQCVICDKYTTAAYPGYFCSTECRDKMLSNPIEKCERFLKAPDYKLDEISFHVYKNPNTLPSMLYDITVEDDHSFVVNGIISKNCRCLTLYLPKDWKVTAGGNLEYVGPGYDQYSEQSSLRKTIDNLSAFFGHECLHEHEI